MAKIPTPGSPEEADAARARLSSYRANRLMDTPSEARARQVSMPDPVKLEQTQKDEDLYRGNLNEEPVPVKNKTKTKTKAKATAPAMKASAPAAKADPNAELRADLLASKKADDAARAAAERKRQEAEAFSANLKSTTKKGGNKTGYAAYQSLMGE